MSWKDNLIQASFRGAKFYVKKSEASFGRKLKTYNPWGLNFAVFEDQGLANREYVIEGYVVQNSSNDWDYMTSRDKLIKAFEGGDQEKQDDKWVISSTNVITGWGRPGILKHPYYGEQKVVLKQPAIFTETSDEGGICRFNAIFLRWSPNDTNVGDALKMEPLTAVMDAALDTFNSAIDTFHAVMNFPGKFINSLMSPIKQVFKGITSGINSIVKAPSKIMSAARGACSTALNGIDAVLDSPCDLASGIASGFDSFKTMAGFGTETVTGGVVGKCSGELRGTVFDFKGKSLLEQYGMSLVYAVIQSQNMATKKDVEDGISESDDKTNIISASIPEEQKNSLMGIIDLSKTVALCNAAQIAIIIDFNSKQNAEEIQSVVVSALDDLLDRLGDENHQGVNNSDANQEEIDSAYSLMFTKISSLRSTFVKAMQAKNANVKSAVDYVIGIGVVDSDSDLSGSPDNVSALELSYNRYQSLDRVDEILSMNKPTIKHPGFLNTGSRITILES